ncbi:MAG: nodulation protein NfeD [Chloroflexi bacterium]|nr:nodulation protein NfeD [Chloroflexota bacterium]
MQKLSRILPVFLIVLLGFRGVQAQGNEIIALEIEGVVTPIMQSYFERGIAIAEANNAEAVLITMDTPGGAVVTTLEIVELFRNADVPIIMYIGPNGAQAASAGSVITAAAHVSGMAQETVIGAASPISGDGSDIEDTAYRKTVEDLKATMRTLTDRRGEEAVTLAEEMIEDARAVTAQEALDAGFIDVIATDVDALLLALDGKEVLVNDEAQILEIADASLNVVSLNFIEQLLFILANPLIIGALIAIGTQALIFEVTNPGGWAAGVTGVILISLGLLGAGQLPVNYFGFGLIIIAFGLFIGEAFTPTSGALSITGAIVLLAGILVLFNSPGTPEFARISISGAVAITAVSAAFFIFLVTKVIKSRDKQPATGAEGLVGQIAAARADFKPNEKQSKFSGTVLVMGEIWRAESDVLVEDDDSVIIKSVNGFTLKIGLLTPEIDDQV